MDLLRQKVIEELWKAREELLSIRKDALTADFLFGWFEKYKWLWDRAERYKASPWLYLYQTTKGYGEESDPDILDHLRAEMVEVLDRTINQIDSEVVVRPLLQERILRVKDTKLATLLKEFDEVKDIAPNAAAILFRTILGLVILERAKRVKPTSRSATSTDIDFKQGITRAVNEGIFSDAEKKLLQNYSGGGQKVFFDCVTHKAGDLYLIDKSNLEDAVDLLNILLASIID